MPALGWEVREWETVTHTHTDTQPHTHTDTHTHTHTHTHTDTDTFTSAHVHLFKTVHPIENKEMFSPLKACPFPPTCSRRGGRGAPGAAAGGGVLLQIGRAHV